MGDEEVRMLKKGKRRTLEGWEIGETPAREECVDEGDELTNPDLHAGACDRVDDMDSVLHELQGEAGDLLSVVMTLVRHPARHHVHPVTESLHLGNSNTGTLMSVLRINIAGEKLGKSVEFWSNSLSRYQR